MALWTLTGSVYMRGNYTDLASVWALETLPAIFWTGLGITQIILAIGMLISVKNNSLRKFATPSALGLAVIFLSGIVLYSSYVGIFGVLWAIIPAALFGFIAYKRKN